MLRTRSLDAHDFERLVQESRSAGSSEALAQLNAALALWNGDALADFADESWAQATAISLSELRASAIEDRAEILLGISRWADAIVAMELHIAHYPLRDRPRGLLMRALAADGRQTEALRSYQIYRHYLSEEVGTEPSSEVRALEAKIAELGEALRKLQADAEAKPAPDAPQLEELRSSNAALKAELESVKTALVAANATAAAGADLGSGLRNASHLGRRSFARMEFHIRFHPS